MCLFLIVNYIRETNLSGKLVWLAFACSLASSTLYASMELAGVVLLWCLLIELLVRCMHNWSGPCMHGVRDYVSQGQRGVVLVSMRALLAASERLPYPIILRGLLHGGQLQQLEWIRLNRQGSTGRRRLIFFQGGLSTSCAGSTPLDACVPFFRVVRGEKANPAGHVASFP